MPYSSVIRGYIRTTTTPFLTMSLRPSSSLQFHLLRSRHVDPKRILKPSGFSVMKGRYAQGFIGSVHGPSRAVACLASAGAYTRGAVEFDWRESQGLVLWQRGTSLPFLQQQQQNSRYGRFAYEDYSEEDSDREVASSQQCASTLDNNDEWRLKLTMLLRNKDDQEVVSRERKDRRDFVQLSALASRMGLYSRQYAKVVVFSKVPLQNYRPDLDDKRPQREVNLPSGLQREVEAHLKLYLSQKSMSKGGFPDNALSRSGGGGGIASDGLYKQQEPLLRTSVLMEKILQRKSLQLRDQQQDWQESSEGQKMLEFRRSLPAYKERDTLLKAISQNQVIVVSGETGCGKTTQLPQYILESAFEAACGAACSIICTQPRRISAMAVSERVAAERGEKLGESVGYKVRLEGMKGKDTRLLFCTTGILLRKLLVDRNLNGVTHVIVDEIHERGMNEDFLLIVMKDLLLRRPELRLILMSATLNAELFSSYFGGAPMIHIPGFTYPVRTHYLEDILETTGYTMTPFNQIDDYGQEKMWKMQKQALRKRKSQIASAVEDALEAADFKEYSLRTQESLSCWNPDSIGFNLIEHVLCHIVKKEGPGAVLVFMIGWDDINYLKDQLQAHPLLGDPSRVLLLACHGSMASSEQRLIFDKPEDGVRKIVLATNMAETSITINDVVFVIDCGKAKETSYDALNNTPCLLPSWISKAAARQGLSHGLVILVFFRFCREEEELVVFNLASVTISIPDVYNDSFADYQLPELLRTPLHSLCLQIKSLQLGSISEFLSRALQTPEPLSVQNAIEYLKIIGALDENENLTVLGRHLSVLPVEPKLGKMLILGAIFKCLDPLMTVVAGLSGRDPFLLPFDKKDLAESAKAKFSACDYSDHLALVRAFEGWKDAEIKQSGYEYCWRNFLSAQSLKAIDSLRKQFFSLLKDTGLVDYNTETCNKWRHDEHLIRAIICAGLFPGICSVVNKEKSILLKTMEDGQVLLYSNSVNAREPKIPYPWLVFNEKVKVNTVFLRDSTAVSDSVLLLFGGKISRGGVDGHLKMLGGYLEFFMEPALANTYLSLKEELEEIIQNKLLNPKLDIHSHNELLSAVGLLVSEDQNYGRFVFSCQVPTPSKNAAKETFPVTLLGSGGGGGGADPKGQLQTLLARAGHEAPTYKTRELLNLQFCSTVVFNGMEFAGQPSNNKKLAEKDAAAEALQWLAGETQSRPNRTQNSPQSRPNHTQNLEKDAAAEALQWLTCETQWRPNLTQNSHQSRPNHTQNLEKDVAPEALQLLTGETQSRSNHTQNSPQSRPNHTQNLEKYAAPEALQWLTGEAQSRPNYTQNSPQSRPNHTQNLDKDVAPEALQWLTGETQSRSNHTQNLLDRMSKLRSKKKQ